MNENYYRILGLDNFASQKEVKEAYRKLAKKYHPDKHPDKPSYEDKFKRISTAYSVLRDDSKKAHFDEKLKYKTSINTSNSPRYASAPFYSTKKRKYTPTAWMYARIFIIAFIMAVVLIPLTLLYQSSVRYYERGLEALEQGDIDKSLLNFNRAMTQFGGRSVEA
ncbi:J domain-containing protein, partial [Fulvivirga sp. RKSG066]|uniref:J domain-containing protein n=1 Tax=Fulvivirga aurantia TaxID=2529383 RepID=UPI0012BCA29E